MLLTKRNGILAALVLSPLLLAGALKLRSAAGQRTAIRSRHKANPDPPIKPGTPSGPKGSRWTGVVTYDETQNEKVDDSPDSNQVGTTTTTGKSWARYEVSGETKDDWNKNLITLHGTGTGEIHRKMVSDSTERGPNITKCPDMKARSTDDGAGSAPVTVNISTYYWTETQYHYEIDVPDMSIPVQSYNKIWNSSCPEPDNGINPNTSGMAKIVISSALYFDKDCPPPFSSDVDPDRGGNTCLAGESRYDTRPLSGSKTWTSLGGYTHHVTWEFLVLPPKPTQ